MWPSPTKSVLSCILGILILTKITTKQKQFYYHTWPSPTKSVLSCILGILILTKTTTKQKQFYYHMWPSPTKSVLSCILGILILTKTTTKQKQFYYHMWPSPTKSVLSCILGILILTKTTTKQKQFYYHMWPSPTKSVLSCIFGYFERCINLNIATSADYVGIYMKTAVKELLKLGLFKLSVWQPFWQKGPERCVILHIFLSNGVYMQLKRKKSHTKKTWVRDSSTDRMSS